MMHGLPMKIESGKQLACWKNQLPWIPRLERQDIHSWVLKLIDNDAGYYFLLLLRLYLYFNFFFVSSAASLHAASVLKTILVLGLKWRPVVIPTVSHAGKVCRVCYYSIMLLPQI